jgi:hypothetical protein
MMAVFYQTSTPVKNTPYRQIVLKHDQTKGWVVLRFAGTEWVKKDEADHVPEREEVVKDEAAGKIIYDQWFNEIQNAGWRLYDRA